MTNSSSTIYVDNVPFRHALIRTAEEVVRIMQTQTPQNSKPTFAESNDESDVNLSSLPINMQKLAMPEKRDSSTATTETDITYDELEESRTENLTASTCFRLELKKNSSFRREEKELIRKSYEDRRNEEVSSSILFLTGPSGSGKSSLANSLRDSVVSCGGYFVTGKFDFLMHPWPYQFVVSAFTEFTNMVVDRGDKEVEFMKNSILEAVGEESYILTNMIPSLSRILGDSPSTLSSNAKAQDAISRFTYIFARFLGSICSPEKPLVLLLDDLHWTDLCSMWLFTQVAKNSENHGFFLIGTYNDSAEVPVNPFLYKQLSDLDQSGCMRVTKLNVGNVSYHSLTALLARALRITREEEAKRFGQIVFDQTLGNLLKVDLFLRWLEQRQLLVFDDLSKWFTFDCNEIALDCTEYVVNNFLRDELLKLSQQTQDALKVAACIGFQFDQHQIECVLGFSVEDAMNEALTKGFLGRLDGQHKYSFDHDIVHSVCYGLIPESDKELFHVEVGRRLWRGLGKNEVSSNLFVILAQILKGQKLITREKERYALANLCLHAGTKAAKASTFRVATIYLRLGVGFLDERSWRSNYDLCLSIFNAAAEMEMCFGNLEEMELLVETTLRNVMRCEDKLQPYSTRIYGVGMSGRRSEAIDIGIEVLHCLGETFPKRLCKAALFAEMNGVKKLLQGKTDADVLHLPHIENEKKQASMSVLSLIYVHTLFARPVLAPFVALKLMKLTLKYGLSVYSSMAFSVYGMTLIGAKSDIEKAYRFGKLGLELLSKYKLDQYLPRVYAAFYGCIFAWKRPVKDALTPLYDAHRVGFQTGDIEFSALCASLHCFLALDSGMTLPEVLKRYRYFRDIASSNRQLSVIKLTFPCIQTICSFMGQPEDFSLTDEIGAPTDSTTGWSEFGYSKLRIAYMFNDFEKAEELVCSIEEKSWAMPPTIDRINAEFTIGLVALQLASSGRHYKMNLRRARACIRAFKKYALNCPSNFSDKRFLLEAELAMVEGRHSVALENYTIAIALAQSSGFLFHEALANERCARFLVSAGKLFDAESYYQRSLDVYGVWGAEAKVTHLRNEMGGLGLFVKSNRS